MKILITGASSGIGKSIAKLCLEKNYQVHAIARDFKKCEINHFNFFTYPFDLSKIDLIEDYFKNHLLSKLPFDAAIFCAGAGIFKTIEQFSFLEIQYLINLNFTSHFLLAKCLAPSMKKQRCGTLIFMGSEAALNGKSFGTLYCASKFALRGFAQALRKESSKSGVRVSLINPGMVKTPFFDRLSFAHAPDESFYCTPEQIAQATFEILEAKSNLVFDELNITPLKHQVISKQNKSDLALATESNS